MTVVDLHLANYVSRKFFLELRRSVVIDLLTLPFVAVDGSMEVHESHGGRRPKSSEDRSFGGLVALWR
jgi:hypothetical protein